MGQEMKELSRVMEMFHTLVGMVVMWYYTFVKTQQTIFLKSAHTSACKNYNLIKKNKNIKEEKRIPIKVKKKKRAMVPGFCDNIKLYIWSMCSNEFLLPWDY